MKKKLVVIAIALSMAANISAPVIVRAEQKQTENIEVEREAIPESDYKKSEITVLNAGNMSISQNGIDLIKSFEGCRLEAYKALSTEQYYTIGWGHYGPDVTAGMKITQAQADAMLEEDLKVYVSYVNTFLNKYDITINQNQFDALCSFTYNLGNVWNSSKYPTFQLKTYLINGVNNYSDSEIRTAFTNWNKSGGNVVAGLTKRRNAEADLFLSSGLSNVCNCSSVYAGNYTCTTSSLPLTIRSGHGSNYSKVGSIPSGATVYVSKASGTGAGNWAHVEYNGVSGYASMEYLEKQDTGKDPHGVVDSASGGFHSVNVAGWAIDEDDYNTALQIHIYLDGQGIGIITADQYRPDVNNVYGCGDYHGYDAHIEVYAINIGGGKNTLIGEAKVNISKDTEAPVISDYKVTDVTTTGYTVSCTVTDNFGVDRVQFPTWTQKDGQDDIIQDWGTNAAASGARNGDTYTYQVNIADHNNESGLYNTHIYAYDKYGNSSTVSINSIEVPTTPDVSEETYTLTYDANGGEDAPEKETGEQDNTLKISEDTPIRRGYEFIGWSMDKDAKTAEYQAGDEIKLKEDTTLYAVWEKIAEAGTCGKNLSWEINKQGVLTIYGDGAMQNYTYKSEMPWYRYLSKIKSVVIEKGVTTIGDYAFYGMTDTTNITIPEGVKTIGAYAFKNSAKLEQVELPSTLTRLGESAFYGCTSLKKIAIPEGMYTVWSYTFKNCTSLEEVTLPDSLIKIDEAAFYGCTSLKKITIPDDVSIIGVYCFKNCSALSEINLPENLPKIREASFYGTAVTEMTIPDSVTSIGAYAFKNCGKLEKIHLSKELKTIGDSAFYACDNLTKLSLPQNVEEIDDYAFRKCEGIQVVTFPDTLKKIGESAFYGCSGLSELVLPDEVAEIGAYAFKNCSNIYTVTLPETLNVLEDSVFYGCSRITSIGIPESINTIGNYAFSRCTELSTVYFNGAAPTIADYAFAKVNATVMYPGDESWTEDILQNYGGTLTWKSTATETEHDFSIRIDHKDSTCTEAGYDVYKCANCDETETIELDVDPENHVYSETDRDLQYIYYTCEQCGEIKQEFNDQEYTIDLGNGETTTVVGHYDLEMRQEILDICNEKRVRFGYEPLTLVELDSPLQDAANIRGYEIAYQYSHTRPNGERAIVSFYDYAYCDAENIAGGQETAAEVCHDWFASDSHNTAIMDNSYRTIGISVFVEKVDEEEWGVPYINEFVQLFSRNS